MLSLQIEMHTSMAMPYMMVNVCYLFSATVTDNTIARLIQFSGA